MPSSFQPDSKTPALSRPVLIYDGECGFCRRWVERFRHVTGDTIEYAPSQPAAPRFPEIPPQAFEESVWLVEPTGKVTGAAEAVFRALALAGKKKWMLWGYEHLPGLAPLTERFYELVSHHRGAADKIDRWLLPDPQDSRRSFALTRSIFLRALGVVYLAAFLSLWVQVDGLIGGRGILPARQYLSDVHVRGTSIVAEFIRLPTLCWISSTDSFLHVLSLGGAVLSCVLILGIFPLPALALLWLLYLSLVNVGQVFLGYQWDALLLETGFLAIFFAPLEWRLRARGSSPSRLVLLLLRWLLFRLMFLSGIVKLASQDPTWRALTAMRYHYQTQPLPAWTSWYAHLAPNWFQAFSVAVVFFCELLVPVLFFSRRSRRLFACGMTVIFQVLIAATGNYGFFNLLAIVLCLTLIDDAVWTRFARKSATPLAKHKEISGWISIPLALLVFPLSLVPAMEWIGYGKNVPRPLAWAYSTVSQFNSINAYGLFASMTTERPELIIEGSEDGNHWLAYEFKWKPGDVYRHPRFCGPHMPRLDWQLWFAAVEVRFNGRLERWLPSFLDRLRDGSPPVLRLLGKNPFPDHSPRYLRVELYDYRFTTYRRRSASGAWWERDYLGELPLGVRQ